MEVIRLVDLAPEWIVVDGREVGIKMSCPCCEGFAIGILFANPLDGGPALRQDGRTPFDHSGIRYRRSGETFADLTIDGVILSSKAHHWAGHIERGEVST